MLSRLLVALALVAGFVVAAPQPAVAACPAGTVSTTLSSGTFGVTAVCLPTGYTPPGGSGTSSGSGFVYMAVLYCVTTPTGTQAIHAGTEAAISGVSDAARRVPCPASADSGPTPAEIVTAARRAAASITIPPVAPRYGPTPDLNPWGLIPVGYPIWLFVPPKEDITTTVVRSGITVSITARRTRTVFAMGNGKSVTCTASTPWTPSVTPGSKSPNCGYAYPAMNQAAGRGFTVTATDYWSVAWSALDMSGTLTMTAKDTFKVPVGELQSLIVERG